MGYTIKEGHVRVDLFKDTGKWYSTGSVDMADHYDDPSIHDALTQAMEKNGIEGLTTKWREWVEQGGSIVCLRPYHVHSHPICVNRAELNIQRAWSVKS